MPLGIFSWAFCVEVANIPMSIWGFVFGSGGDLHPEKAVGELISSQVRSTGGNNSWISRVVRLFFLLCNLFVAMFL